MKAPTPNAETIEVYELEICFSKIELRGQMPDSQKRWRPSETPIFRSKAGRPIAITEPSKGTGLKLERIVQCQSTRRNWTRCLREDD